MDYKHCCVIDADCKYKTLVLVMSGVDENGNLVDEVLNYTLLSGERLVNANPPHMRVNAETDGFINPVWDFGIEAWVETATAEEIAAWEAANPAPIPEPTPSPEDYEARIATLEEELSATKILLGVE